MTPPKSFNAALIADHFRQSALELAAEGFYVIPLIPKAKLPVVKSGERHSNSTTDPATINQWWAEHRDANPGIVTGAREGLFVFEVDPRHGGLERLAELELTFGRLPETRAVLSGSGGTHYYFNYPQLTDRRYIKTHAGIKIGGKQMVGLDVRGRGGLIVGPGGYHANAEKFYIWLNDYPIADAPDWLIEHICGVEDDPNEKPVYASFSVNAGQNTVISRLIEDVLGNLAATPEGARHNNTRDAAFYLGGLCAGAGWDSFSAINNLKRAVSGFNDPRKHHKTIEESFSKGYSKPVSVAGFELKDCLTVLEQAADPRTTAEQISARLKPFLKTGEITADQLFGGATNRLKNRDKAERIEAIRVIETVTGLKSKYQSNGNGHPAPPAPEYPYNNGPPAANGHANAAHRLTPVVRSEDDDLPVYAPVEVPQSTFVPLNPTLTAALVAVPGEAVFVQHFIDYCKKWMPGMPVEFARASAFWTLSTAIAGRATLYSSQGETPLNLFCFIVGPSGSSKSKAQTVAHEVLNLAGLGSLLQIGTTSVGQVTLDMIRKINTISAERWGRLTPAQQDEKKTELTFKMAKPFVNDEGESLLKLMVGIGQDASDWKKFFLMAFYGLNGYKNNVLKNMERGMDWLDNLAIKDAFITWWMNIPTKSLLDLKWTKVKKLFGDGMMARLLVTLSEHDETAAPLPLFKHAEGVRDKPFLLGSMVNQINAYLMAGVPSFIGQDGRESYIDGLHEPNEEGNFVITTPELPKKSIVMSEEAAALINEYHIFAQNAVKNIPQELIACYQRLAELAARVAGALAVAEYASISAASGEVAEPFMQARHVARAIRFVEHSRAAKHTLIEKFAGVANEAREVDDKIVEILKKHGELTHRKLYQLLNIDGETLEKRVRPLLSAGIVENFPAKNPNGVPIKCGVYRLAAV